MCVTGAETSVIAMPTNFGGNVVSDCKHNSKRRPWPSISPPWLGKTSTSTTKGSCCQKENQNFPPPTFRSYFGAKTEALVNPFTIDSLVNVHRLTSLHAIKLDCEGAEHLALQGCLQALKQFCPPHIFQGQCRCIRLEKKCNKIHADIKKDAELALGAAAFSWILQ
jgi:hypothetical protein